ncbi:SDR family NAD(P)-dependent oxidoreductase [Naasia lichenicola]|uniref:SDR family NAD(P)-dependent oxidoreductase n=1 Tax=Naasia lichenicola TaxID=2565933 RepID=UPI00130E9BD1|nr:SDR family NAD(P)-dependent oxidoreductase [Naasia lichenicola]
MDLRLEDKIAVITGAGTSVGLSVARALLLEDVFVVAGSPVGSLGLIQLAEEYGLIPLIVDLTTPDGASTLLQSAKRAYGGIDMLVNAIGISAAQGASSMVVPRERWQSTFDQAFVIARSSIRAAIPLMIARGGGTILTVWSAEPGFSLVDHGDAKAVFRSLAKAMAAEFATDGVRFNSIGQGPAAVDPWHSQLGIVATAAKFMGIDIAQSKARMVDSLGESPTGRIEEPGEVGDLVILVVSKHADHTADIDFSLDGDTINVG